VRLTSVVTLVLLVATATAFVHTQRQKLEPSPLAVLRVDETFAPLCNCPTKAATIEFELRRRSRITLAVVDERGDVVRTLIDDRRPEGVRVTSRWDGRDASGDVVPDGVYQPRLRVAVEQRTFLLTNRIQVDTKPPQATLVRVAPDVLREEGDHISAWYRLSETSQPLLLVNGRVRVRGTPRRREGKLDWYGRTQGRMLPNGRYRLQLSARDEAGNLAEPTPEVRVRIRIR